ncbi:MAG TPA: OmpW family outer membrane protein [Thermoanaerobaculia bacterium]|nr:OmpW family outer membrane protein [Thermoanaerobaculia bacterium]
MRFATLIAALLLTAAPAPASDRILEVAGWYVWLEPRSQGTFIGGSPAEPFDVELDSDTGYGLSALLFFGRRVSAEVGVAQISSAISLEARGRTANLLPRQTTLMPVTGTLQLHLAPRAMIDPYIGVGAMLLLVGNVSGGRETDLSVQEIERGGVVYLLNFGLSIELTEQFGWLIDAKWVPLGSDLRGFLNDPQRTGGDISVSPIMVSMGLSYRFGR